VRAGTNSQVFFELFGTAGSSGTIFPVCGNSEFERGCADTFLYPRLPHLGQLLQLKVGTDGGGMFPGWHLRLVEVAHIASGERWTFPCHEWLDRRCGWQRLLGTSKG
jgi:hypothetical protein